MQLLAQHDAPGSFQDRLLLEVLEDVIDVNGFDWGLFPGPELPTSVSSRSVRVFKQPNASTS